MSEFRPKLKRVAKSLAIDFVIKKLNTVIRGQKKLLQRVERMEHKLEELHSSSQGPDSGAQIMLAMHYRELASKGTVLPFRDVEFRNYSQFGEDGILHYIFSLIGTVNKRAVEMCAGVGSECNCANLILRQGWEALLVDGNEKKVQQGREFFLNHPDSKFSAPVFLHRWINRDNVNHILEEFGFVGEIDLFSLDMDSTDYWIWEAIDRISPRVVIAEINLHMGTEPVTVPYADEFETDWIVQKDGGDQNEAIIESRHPIQKMAMYGGASLAALNKLAKRKGYRLIGSNRHRGNVLFMRNDVGTEYFPEVPEEECYPAGLQALMAEATKKLLERELVSV